MSYIPEYHENYYRVEGTAYNQGKIGIGTINPVQLLHVSGGNIRLDGTGYFNGDLNVTGNLNVYGTTAQFAVSQIIAEDKSIELNVQTGIPIGGGNYTTVAFSDDAGADFGGLIVKSTSTDTTRSVTDKHLVYKTSLPNSGWVSNLRFVVSGNYGKDTLNLSDTTANVGITIATDTNLYRSGANQLNTDDNFASTFNGGKTTFQLTDTTANVGMTIGGDTNLYRSGAGVLQTDSLLSTTANSGKNTLHLNNTAFNVGMTIGQDTNLYRSAASTLKTDSSFIVDGASFAVNSASITLGDAATDTVTINAGPVSLVNATAAADALEFGNGANLANLYRSTNDTLRTDDSLIVNVDLSVNGNTTLGDANTDTVSFNGRANTNLEPSTDKTRNLGSSTLSWSTGYLNTLSGSYLRLTNSPVILNTSTTGDALLHIRANSTRPILAQSEFSGVTFAYQPSFIDKNSIVHLYARNGSTTTDNFGFGSLNPAGTPTARAVTGTNFYAATKRIGYTTTSLLTAVGIRDDGSPQWMRGASGFGGFYFKSRFGIGEMDGAISGKTRGFIGMTSLLGNILSNNPSARGVDMLGMGFDSGDSTWSFFHNSGASNSTKIPLVNYNCTTKSGNFIEFSMYALPESGVGFHANIANSGNSYATGYYATTNLPALGTLMTPNLSLYHTNTVSVTGIALDINGVYIESYK